MKQLVIILKLYLCNLFGINRIRFTADKKERSRLTGMLIVMCIVGVMMFVMALAYLIGIAYVMRESGNVQVVIGIGAAAGCVVALVTTIFKAGPTLFGFSDYPLIMSLPVSHQVVTLSRVARLYGSNLFFGLFVTLPAGIAYAIFAPITAWFVIGYSLVIILLPLIPITIASAIGTFVSIIASCFKWKNAVAAALTMVFVVGIMALSMMSQQLVENFEGISQAIADAVYKLYPPALWVVGGVCEGNALQYLAFALISLAIYTLFIFVAGKFLKPLHTAFTRSKASGRIVRAADIQSSSKLRALFFKELKRFSSSVLYLTNMSAGAVMALLIAVGVAVFNVDINNFFIEYADGFDLVAGLIPFMLAMFVGMAPTTACCISIEGKHFWTLKKLPLSPSDIFIPKLLLSLTINVPASLISSTIIAVALRTSLIDTLMLYLLPVSFVLLSALLGLRMNLSYPKLTWKAEVEVIKQGAPLMINVLVTMFSMIIAIIIATIFMLEQAWILSAIATAIALLVSAMLWRGIKVNGERLLARIH